MRVYIRLAPLKRPVQVDVDPSASVADLCARIGVEALCLSGRPTRETSPHGADVKDSPPGRSPSADAVPASARGQVLDSGASVASVVPPHATLIAALHPLAGRRQEPGPSREARYVGDRAPAGEWHVVRKPTPCVTATAPPSEPKSCIPAFLPTDVIGRDLETPTLGEDWEELSLIMEADDASPSASDTGGLAEDVMQKVLEWQHSDTGQDQTSSAGLDSQLQAPHASSPSAGTGAREAVGGQFAVFAWGDNSLGQCFTALGTRTLPAPRRVAEDSPCVSCWCGSQNSVLGTRNGVQLVGRLSASLEEIQGAGVRVAAAGQEHAVVITQDGSLQAWSLDPEGGSGLVKLELAMPKPLLWPAQSLCSSLRALSVACGDTHSLVLTECGRIFAFGSNTAGQLGLGRRCKGLVAEPTAVGGKARGTPLRAVAAGAEHSLALTVSGALLTWGSNADGCLGLGQAKSSHAEVHLPELVPSLPGPAKHIAAGGRHSAVVLQKGELLLTGSNASGQLGRSRSELLCSHEFIEPSERLCTQSISLGREHSVLLTHDGELYAFGRNTEGQCGVRPEGEGSGSDSSPGTCIEAPVHLRLPQEGGEASISSLFVGDDHTLVFCSLPQPAPPLTPPLTRVPVPPAAGPPPARRPSRRPPSGGGQHAAAGPRPASPPVVETSPPQTPSPEPSAEPQPSRPSSAFVALSLAQLAPLLAETPCSAEAVAEAQQALCTALALPSVLNASLCHSGLQSPHLDAAGLCRLLVLACGKEAGLAQRLIDAAGEGLSTLASGPVDDLVQRDQVRALAVYLCLPPGRPVASASGRATRTLLGSLAHLLMRMSSAGRRSLRDLLADECGDVRVLRDVLLPHARLLADEAIRGIGQQPWLTGPLWEVVAQLQLQRALWEAVLLLQLLASASEEAARLVQPVAADLGLVPGTPTEEAGGGGTPSRLPQDLSSLGSSAHAEILSFQLSSLAEGYIPPEVEFWLFQEHAQFRQITPEEVVSGPCWSDAAGMPPRRFCSFMAHANLVPVAFKQRVLQVENVLRQRLSQEQVLWPQVDLGNGRNAAAFYFMLRVNREELLRDTFRQMYSASPADLRRPLRVEFCGEEAIDEGGVMREFFRLLSQELFSPAAGLFVETEESRRRWFRPAAGGAERELEDYWMVGVIVALAVYNNHPGLDIPLPSALFKMLKDEPTTHKDLAQLYPSHARSLETVMAWSPTTAVDSEATAALADAEFTDTFCLSHCISPPCGDGEARLPEVPLCEGGAEKLVLYRDREAFVSRVHEYLLCTSVQPQFESFSRGFRRVCNSPLFNVLSSEELQAIVGGEKDLDLARLRHGAQYEGYSGSEPYIHNFWTVLEGFSMPRRRRFLAFCTGSDVSPAGGLQDLRLLVQRHGEEPTMRLPVAHTCFNLLLLPRYSSVEKLRTMLITAVDWTEGFGLQ